jgi:predicted ATPase
MEDGPRIFEAVALLLRLLAIARPLIVVLEDLHWSDDTTVRLLRFLPRRLRGQPVMLLGTARLEEIGHCSGRGAVLEGLRHDASYASTILAPLSRDQTMDLLRAITATASDDWSTLAERVWQLSEGNPFVVLECGHGSIQPCSGHVHHEERPGKWASLHCHSGEGYLVVGETERSRT